jgi:hypothetical protein
MSCNTLVGHEKEQELSDSDEAELLHLGAYGPLPASSSPSHSQGIKHMMANLRQTDEKAIQKLHDAIYRSRIFKTICVLCILGTLIPVALMLIVQASGGNGFYYAGASVVNSYSFYVALWICLTILCSWLVATCAAFGSRLYR